MKKACEHPQDAYRHIQISGGLSLQRLATWCSACGALNDGTWKTPSSTSGLRTALEKINAIRNSIIGTQTINWSEHIYPLVAALDEAGMVGEPHDVARANVGTLIERAEKAEAELATLRCNCSLMGGEHGPGCPAITKEALESLYGVKS